MCFFDFFPLIECLCIKYYKCFILIIIVDCIYVHLPKQILDLQRYFELKPIRVSDLSINCPSIDVLLIFADAESMVHKRCRQYTDHETF